MRHLRRSCGVALLILTTSAAAFGDAPQPSADAIRLARSLVEASGAGGMAAMNGIALPLPQILTEIGVTKQEQRRVVVHEAIMPTLNEHSDDLTDIQIRSYASLLSIDDLKAAIAFYDSPAGKDLVKYKFKLIQANMAGGFSLIATLKPEIEAKAQDVRKAHGWSKG
jgi:hypothetical protein